VPSCVLLLLPPPLLQSRLPRPRSPSKTAAGPSRAEGAVLQAAAPWCAEAVGNERPTGAGGAAGCSGRVRRARRRSGTGGRGGGRERAAYGRRRSGTGGLRAPAVGNGRPTGAGDGQGRRRSESGSSGGGWRARAARRARGFGRGLRGRRGKPVLHFFSPKTEPGRPTRLDPVLAPPMILVIDNQGPSL
jgi:hypothetical protein